MLLLTVAFVDFNLNNTAYFKYDYCENTERL